MGSELEQERREMKSATFSSYMQRFCEGFLSDCCLSAVAWTEDVSRDKRLQNEKRHEIGHLQLQKRLLKSDVKFVVKNSGHFSSFVS